MRHPYKLSLAVVLGLLALIVMSAPAGAVDVTDCGDFASSNPSDSRFDLRNSIATTGTGTCLTFPSNATVFMNGFAVVGPGLDSGAVGIAIGDNNFLWGPGLIRGFTVCASTGNHSAVERILFNQCAAGIVAGNQYKIKEVRVHDCTPSSFTGVGIALGRGGFVESSIVRACDFGVVTGQNNKIWDLVVTRSLFTGLQVDGGNAVSRTVISHPRSVATIGLDYTRCGPAGSTAAVVVGCQDGSNSVSGHSPADNIVLGAAAVVTQSSDLPNNTATNCNGNSLNLRDPITGLFLTGC
jgi:hypothetical protein